MLICGGRDFNGAHLVYLALDAAHGRRPISLLIHGAAPGADTLAGAWAASRGVPALSVPALWHAQGAKAGPLRNQAMLEGVYGLVPEGVIAFPGARGTADMVKRATAAGLQVWQPKPKPN
jgi:hypothetical protein